MDLKIETVLAVYDEKLLELQKENLLLKAQLKQLELDSQKEKEK